MSWEAEARTLLLARLGAERMQSVLLLEEADSTNLCLKRLAQGAPCGQVAIARGQTAGRGRLGRSFSSPPGLGLYLSVLLRLKGGAEPGLITGCAAVAAVRAVERACGARPGIKWVNDLVLGGKKLGGILAEAANQGNSRHVVLGVGINVLHTQGQLEPGIRGMATSLRLEGYGQVLPIALAAELILQLDELRLGQLELAACLAEYRSACVTTGRQVLLSALGTGQQAEAFALGINDDFSLRVRMESTGTEADISSGEASVRGINGYI